MDSGGKRKVVSFRDLTDGKDVSVVGEADIHIGLSMAGNLTVTSNQEDLCMPLLMLMYTHTGGFILSSTNKDLPCVVNEETELFEDMDLQHGTTLEVAGKKLLFIDGPIPKQRRKLPKTPGMPLEDVPPQKPGRPCSTQRDMMSNETREEGHTEENEERPGMEDSWCALDFPSAEQQLLTSLQTPEQISVGAGSYFCRQIRMFTDLNLTSELIDEIFKLFRAGVTQLMYAFEDYLRDIETAISNTKNHQSRPMHGPAIRLLTELLKHYIEPISKVELILLFIQTFSHFDDNLVTMVTCQTTAPVLGCMGAYLDEANVQELGVNIVSRIARFKPRLKTKSPVREAAVEMVLRAMRHHFDNVVICRCGCRALATVSGNLIEVTNGWTETESPRSAVVMDTLRKSVETLTFIMNQSVPVVKDVLQKFYSDIGVNSESRKILFNVSKLEQLKIKEEIWLKRRNAEEFNVNQCEPTSGLPRTVHGKDMRSADIKSSRPLNQRQNMIKKTLADDKSPNRRRSSTGSLSTGILKKVRSFENLRCKEPRLVFSRETMGGSDSDTTASSSDRDSSSDNDSNDGGHHADNEDETHAGTVLDVNEHILGHVLIEGGIVKHKHSEREYFGRSDKENASRPFADVALLPSSVHKGVPEKWSTSEENVKQTFETVKRHDVQCPENKGQGQDRHNAEASDTVPEYARHIMSLHSGQNLDTNRKGDKHVTVDEQFKERLVKTQAIVYVTYLVCEGRESEALKVIDQPIRELLQTAHACSRLLQFAENQYGETYTLLDLDPAVVIKVIDAVRYRVVTTKLLQSCVTALLADINSNLDDDTISIALTLIQSVLNTDCLVSMLKDDLFKREFRHLLDQMEGTFPGNPIVVEICSKNL